MGNYQYFWQKKNYQYNFSCWNLEVQCKFILLHPRVQNLQVETDFVELVFIMGPSISRSYILSRTRNLRLFKDVGFSFCEDFPYARQHINGQ